MTRNRLVRALMGAVPVAVLMTAGCAPPGTGPPAATTAPPATIPTPATGCGLANAAFCEDFEGPRNTSGNRNGDLSTSKVSLARWRSELKTDPGYVDRSQIPACRGGSQSNPLPPGDSLICDPSSVIQSHYAITSTASQNYGDNSYRIGQLFDIANRTGTISFNTSLQIDGGLIGWPTIAFTADPYSAPSYLADNSAGPTPRQGFAIHFNSVCPGAAGWTPFPNVRVYDRYRETDLHDENGFESWCTSNITTAAGKLNHVEIRLSQSHLEVWMTDVSSDGVHFGPLKKVFSSAVNLGFSRGSVYFGDHNHATKKYASLPSWTTFWDNIAFDGPRFVPQRVYQVDDADVASGSGMNLGYWLPEGAGGGATPAFSLANVSTAGTSTASLLFNLGADQISNANWSAWRVNYRVNGGAWHAVGFSADELALMPRSGSYSFSVAIDPKELVNGTNTLQFSGTNFYAGYRPYLGNIDLVLQ